MGVLEHQSSRAEPSFQPPSRRVHTSIQLGKTSIYQILYYSVGLSAQILSWSGRQLWTSLSLAATADATTPNNWGLSNHLYYSSALGGGVVPQVMAAYE